MRLDSNSCHTRYLATHGKAYKILEMKLETAGFQFDYWAVTNAVKREWKDAVKSPTNVCNEDDGNTESSISDMAETIF